MRRSHRPVGSRRSDLVAPVQRSACLVICGMRRFLPVIALLLVGCGGAAGDRIVITGSSTMAPLLLEIATAFEAAHGVRVDVHSGGSGRGLEDVRRGVADIGMVSRALTDAESDLAGRVIAQDGIAIIVNSANPLSMLQREDLLALYQREVLNWRELSSLEAPVVAVHKAAGRATQERLLSYLGVKDDAIKPHLIAGENQEVIKLVAGNAGAIGYVSLGPAAHEARRGAAIRLVNLEGVVASDANVGNGQYPMSRPLTLVYRTQAGDAVGELIAFALSREAAPAYERFGFVQASP